MKLEIDITFWKYWENVFEINFLALIVANALAEGEDRAQKMGLPAQGKKLTDDHSSSEKQMKDLRDVIICEG